MEYIQQAINKAREERKHSDSNRLIEQNAPEHQHNHRYTPTSNIPGKIVYQQTRKVNVDATTLKNNRLIAGCSVDKRAEPYRQLRTQVLHKMRANDWKTLAITSPNENAGKTITALNLAISLSKEVNQTVMLVDLDLRNPSVLTALDITTQVGIVDHLQGKAAIRDILINPGFERLVIMPGKADPNYSSEILSSPTMHALIEDITSRYESRIIVFDLPALLVNDDALAFIPFVDAALLVVEDAATTSYQVERSLQLLSGTHVIGTVLNKVK